MVMNLDLTLFSLCLRMVLEGMGLSHLVFTVLFLSTDKCMVVVVCCVATCLPLNRQYL